LTYTLTYTYIHTYNSTNIVTMAPFKSLLVFISLCSVSAFTPAFSRNTAVAQSSINTALPVFEESMSEWAEEYPDFAKFGWGPSVQAEIWNGRHAMFGWVFLCATAYCKGHGLIPDADSLLDLKEWGTLATISGKNTITNERAIILIANAHLLMVSLCAALAPTSWVDPLLLDESDNSPAMQRAMAREPMGVLPNMGFGNWGLTQTAEALNGRMAMMGLVNLFAYSAISGKPMLDVINEWIGGAYY